MRGDREIARHEPHVSSWLCMISTTQCSPHTITTSPTPLRTRNVQNKAGWRYDLPRVKTLECAVPTHHNCDEWRRLVRNARSVSQEIISLRRVMHVQNGETKRDRNIYIYREREGFIKCKSSCFIIETRAIIWHAKFVH